MACCTAYDHFCKTIGVDGYLKPQPTLHFMTPDGKTSRWRADAIFAPLHFARSFLGAHFLTWLEKIQIGTALMRLWLLPPEDDEPFLDWLQQNDQSERTIQRFWSVVLVSALNESIDRMGIKYARQVFVEAFLSSRTGGQVNIPNVPLGELYGNKLLTWLVQHQVKVRLNTAVKEVILTNGRMKHLVLRDGEIVQADTYILALPPHRLRALFAESLPFLDQVEKLDVSPITSVHFWHDRPITELPHAVLLDRHSQWLFNRGEVSTELLSTMGDATEQAPHPQPLSPGGRGVYYTQVVISAARELSGMGNDAILQLIEAEVKEFFPLSRDARLLHWRVVTEKTATFSVVPGVDAQRPRQTTSIPNLFLAGDYTQTEWPATMEGAVRSGYLAVQALTRNSS
jgi:squalene-associated FAD-dependent desaturase